MATHWQYSQLCPVLVNIDTGQKIFQWVSAQNSVNCNIVSNSYHIVPALQRCVELKIVVANRPV